MAKQTTSLATSQEQQDTGALAALQSVASDRTAWIIDRIADYCYSPGDPAIEKVWAGRGEIVRAAVAEFKVSEEAASQLVRLAEAELWARGQDGDEHVQKTLMVCRLNAVRQMLLTAMSEPRIEKRYQYERDAKDPTKVHKVPVREKETKGLEPAYVRLLLAVEDRRAQLLGLTENAGDGPMTMERLFQELDEDGKVTRKVVRSITQQVKGKGIRDMSKDTLAEVQKIVADQRTRRRKKVKSTVKD
jgi:hypothetical protein